MSLACDAGQSYVDSTKTCYKCDSTCKSCAGTTANQCTSCPEASPYLHSYSNNPDEGLCSSTSCTKYFIDGKKHCFYGKF